MRVALPSCQRSADGVDGGESEDAMTADITLDRQAAIAERRTAYEADVIHALLDEDPDEREERLRLVRLTHVMILRALQLADEPVEN
jgi:hypothetical protein